MEYTSKGDRYENLSPKEYLNVIRPYLRDLINACKPTAELNNNKIIVILVIIVVIIIVVIIVIIVAILIVIIVQNGKFN